MLTRACLTSLLLLAVATPAAADNLEEFGFGPRGQAMGNALTAVADDATATYYNPGGLILSRPLSLHLGFSFAEYGLRFDSTSGGDADDDVERIPDLSAFTLGVSATIPVDVRDRIGIGVGIFLPTRGLLNLKVSANASTPEWFRYGHKHDRVHILPAVGVKITDWLSVGLGASIFIDALGGTTVSTGVAQPLAPSFELKLKPDAGVVFGALLRPASWLSFGLTYRSEVSFKLDFPASAVAQGIAIPLLLESIAFFTPHQVQFGAAVRPTDALLLTVDLLWANWSAYDDPFLVVSSSVAAVPARQSVDLDDVVSPRFGAEFVVNDLLTLRGGYGYRPTMVPSQDNRPTNLVGSDKHVFTAGLGFHFGQEPVESDPGGKDARPPPKTRLFDIDLFVQFHWHTEVSTSRPVGDPVGSWDADGWIINGGIALRAQF